MIGLVTTSFPTREGDPAGSFVLNMANMLAASGHNVEVVAPEPASVENSSGHVFTGQGVKLFHAPYMRPRSAQRFFYGAGVPDNLSGDPRLYMLAPLAVSGLGLGVWRRQSSWDAVISNWLMPSALLCAPLRSNHLAIAHSGDVHLLRRLPRSLAGVLAGLVIRSSNRIGFVSQQLLDEFMGLLPEASRRVAVRKCLVIPLPIDPQDFRSPGPRGKIRKQLGLRKFTALFLGRLVKIKGVDLLIDGISSSEYALVVAGDGPAREDLERQAREARADVTFVGTVDADQRRDLLCACDVLVVPSRELVDGRHEGLPMTIVEGMAAGIPVIATDSGASGEIVDAENNGLLIPPLDPVAIGNALRRIATDPALARRLIAGGTVTAEARSARRISSRYDSLLWSC